MSLQLSNIDHSFGSTHALKGISIDIEQGEQVALIGPSGCGKTTLLRIMGTQIRPTQGNYNLLGTIPTNLTPKPLRKLRTRISMIPQHLGLVPNVRVLSNVLNGSIGKRSITSTLLNLLYQTKSEKEQCYKLLERTGIGEKMYDRTDSLSGGQQQRVAVARALYQEPAIILADEPVSSIDPARARDTIQLLTQLSKEEGITLIVSLHHLALAREFFPRLIGLRQGNVAFDKAPQELSEEECQELYQIEGLDTAYG